MSFYLDKRVKFCNSKKMIFVSDYPQSYGENHTADDLEIILQPKHSFSERETHKKCKVEETEQKFGKSCAAIHISSELSGWLSELNQYSRLVLFCSRGSDAAGYL